MTAAATLGARILRSSALTSGGFVVNQALRLGSNLILTRLLFPEAFGLMAIVTVIIMGLAMFSDIGTGPAIMGSARGDDRDFLDTAFTLQLIRGGALFLAALALTWPASLWYGHPELLTLLPVAALGLIIAAFQPTKLQTAHRHLQAGRVVAVEVATQASALIIGVLAAWWWGSVWALVAASLLSQVIQVILLHLWLPGPANRLRWEPAAARELIGFGKWVFLSTACGFLIGQADKVLIGQWLSLGDFGLYTIAFFLAAFPFLMGSMVMGRVLIPAIRQNPPGENARNFARYRRFRALGTGGLLSMVALLALFGPALVDLMYDPRYQGAGGMVVMLAAVQAPAIVILTCDQVALARGDSRRFFWFTLARGLLVVAGIALGLQMAGLMGGILGLGLANLAAYPVLAWLLRPHGAWDPLHDGAAYAGGLVIFCFAIWYNAPAIAALSAITPG